MTAVLSPTDPLKLDRIMSSHDDNQLNYASNNGTDWKEKYYEVADMLQETRAELDDFQRSSKELEEELERELERTEKAMQDLRVKAVRAESERDDWKAKFMSLQTTHNTATTSLQRELDQLRQEHQQLKVQFRELEMGNDDLERNERAVSSSLADIEAKYAKALEEKILIEHELLDKANIEEEYQRSKDELRDANNEISVLREQLAQARAHAKSHHPIRSFTLQSSNSSTSFFKSSLAQSEEENILTESLPRELHDSFPGPATTLNNVSSCAPLEKQSRLGLSKSVSAPPSSSIDSLTAVHAAVKRAGLPPLWDNSPPPFDTKAAALIQPPSTPSPTRLPVNNSRPTLSSRASVESTSASNNSLSSTATKSRGVQMVSEMRARVRTLEQKLHTRVPRIRMGSISGRKAELPSSKFSGDKPTASLEYSRVHQKIQNGDLDVERRKDASSPSKAGDTSGWVLIMEDSSLSPSPKKDLDKERRRISSPTSSPYTIHTIRKASSVLSTSRTKSISQTSSSRSQSRVSGDGRDSTSTVSTTSIPLTPTSRPSTPTFLPKPISGAHHSPLPSLKRSIGPVHTQKRSSLSSQGSQMVASHLQPPSSYLERERPSTFSMSTSAPGKSVPPPPILMAKRSPSVLVQSRIGRPSFGRKSISASDESAGDHSRQRTTSMACGRIV